MADEETAFPTLDATQISFLETLGERLSMGVGDYLYRSGDDAYDFFVIVSGQVDILLDGDGEERLITQHGAGRFLGELNLLTGQRVFVSARVVEAGRVPSRPRPRPPSSDRDRRPPGRHDPHCVHGSARHSAQRRGVSIRLLRLALSRPRHARFGSSSPAVAFRTNGWIRTATNPSSDCVDQLGIACTTCRP